MKKLAIAALVLGCEAAWPAAAQAPLPPEDAAKVAAVKEHARADKRTLVEKNMQLSADEAKRFWPLYDEYQKSLEKIVQRQNRAVLDYVNAESSMTDANAKRIAGEVLAADADEQKLRERTMRKMIAVLPAKKAVRYMQIENKLAAINRIDIAERIPLVR